jgi:GNAT superfamily N-acetyltransferase
VNLPSDLLERELEAEDLPALRELARVCDETYLEWTPPGWTIPVPPPNFAQNYLAPNAWMHGAFDAAARLVGTVAFRASDEAPTEVAHVGLVFVHPSRWREGIAGTMLERAEGEMVVRGFRREQLWTPVGAPAEHFYQARGWRPSGRREWHPWVGLEMVGYARNLM